MKAKPVRGKKGILDIFIIIIIIFALAVSIIIFYVIIHAIKTPLSETLNNPTSTEVLEKTETTALNYDYIFPITIVFLGIFVIISSFFIRSSPIFFFISVILLVIAILISAILSNTFESFTASPDINASASNFVTTSWFMGNLPLVIAVIFMLAVIVMFAKPWNDGGGGGMV